MPATWSGTDAAVNEAAGFVTSVTFSGKSIGAASSTRIVVVYGCIDNQSGSACTLSATIAGNAATDAVDTGSIASGSFGAGLFYLNLSSGTTADIVLTSSIAGAISKAAIAVGKLDGVNSTPSSTASGKYAASQNSPYPTTTNITVNTGGFGIAGASDNNFNTAMNWGNLTRDQHSEGTSHVAVENGYTSSVGAVAPSATALNFGQVCVLAAAWDASASAGGLKFNSNLDGLSASGGFFRDPLARLMLGWMPGLVTARRRLMMPRKRIMRSSIERIAA